MIPRVQCFMLGIIFGLTVFYLYFGGFNLLYIIILLLIIISMVLLERREYFYKEYLKRKRGE